MKVILASKSPRRRELLSELVDDFEIVTRECDETLPPKSHPKQGVEMLAIRKGGAVIGSVDCDALVISSDTLVELDGVALGKPKDKQDAKSMLLKLSGKGHNVHTGIAVHYKGSVFSGVDSTTVYFRSISESEIDDYIASGEPMDKAGSYGIQGLGSRFVERYDGRFDTVVGLSLNLTEQLMKKALKNE